MRLQTEVLQEIDRVLKLCCYVYKLRKKGLMTGKKTSATRRVNRRVQHQLSLEMDMD